jgi:hypothetical protein
VQLDKTRIVSRERDYLDILDLALRVVREFAGPLFLALALGVAPAMIFNAWILAGYSDQDFDMGFPFMYTALMTLLVGYQIPLVTAPAAVFLGEAVFTERPRPGEILRKLLRGLPQLLLYEGLMRWWYWPWTYLSEVILLEQNPLRGKGAWQLSTRQRSAFLHRGHGGDLFARALFTLLLGGLLLGAIWASFWMLFRMLFGAWEWGNPAFTMFYPLSLWIVVGFFSVVRFLSYLDLRIRREGWEVELLMRAEQVRMTRKLT